VLAYGPVMTSLSRREPGVPRSIGDLALVERTALLARAERDEQAARDARERYRTAPMQPIPVDADLAPQLEPGERLLATRPMSLLQDCAPSDPAECPPSEGAMHLTDRRLLQVGPTSTAIELSLIEELSLAGERLLLTLRDGRGFSIELPRPRLFRVEVATALRATRG
jgi:hypothetical protein